MSERDRWGWLPGQHARPHWWWTPVRVLLALVTVVFALAMVHRAPCIDEDWSGQARYAAMCYSDVPYLYTARGFAEQAWPYSEGRYPGMEYPVGISYVAWGLSVAVAVAPQGPDASIRSLTAVDELWGLSGMADEVNQYFLLTAFLMFAAALLSVRFLAGATRGRPWDALPFAVSPALLLTGLINWDLLAVVCVAGALWAWATFEGRRRSLWIGLFIGLGTAIKLYPLFLLGGVLVVLLRKRRYAEIVLAFAATLVTWLVAQVPAWMGDWERWTLFWTFNSDRAADLGSIWLVLTSNGYGVTAGQINAASWIFFGAACLGVFVLGMTAPRTPTLAQLGFLIVAAFLLVNKVYSPQYVLWLLPLAVIARPRWRDLLIWQAGEVFYFAAVWLYLGGWIKDAGGGGSTAYEVAILVRIVAEIFLMVMVVRDIRASGDDDLVEVGGGEPAAHADPVAHGRDLR